MIIIFTCSKNNPQCYVAAQWAQCSSTEIEHGLEVDVLFLVVHSQDDEEEFEAENEKRDIEQEYKELTDWLNDVEKRASLMEQQWSEEGEEDEPKKKRKAVSQARENEGRVSLPCRPYFQGNPSEAIFRSLLVSVIGGGGSRNR